MRTEAVRTIAGMIDGSTMNVHGMVDIQRTIDAVKGIAIGGDTMRVATGMEV